MARGGGLLGGVPAVQRPLPASPNAKRRCHVAQCQHASADGDAGTQVSGSEASIFNDRPENPSDSEGVMDTTFDTDRGVGCLGEPDTHVSGVEADTEVSARKADIPMSAQGLTGQPTAEGNRPVTYDPFDPFGPPSEDAGLDWPTPTDDPEPPAARTAQALDPEDPLGLGFVGATDSGNPHDPFSASFIPGSFDPSRL
jgi:hypothetical protein